MGDKLTIMEELHPAEVAFYNEVTSYRNWHDAAEKAMKALTASGRVFSADDLRGMLGDLEPNTPNAIGGLFMAWSKAGLITRVGGGPSRGVKRHGGHRHLWIGVGHER